MQNREMEIQRRESLLRQISDVERNLLRVFEEGDHIIARQNDTGEMRAVRSMGGGALENNETAVAILKRNVRPNSIVFTILDNGNPIISKPEFEILHQLSNEALDEPEEFEEVEIPGFGANVPEENGFVFMFDERSKTLTDPTLQYDYLSIEGVNISDVYQMYLSLLSQTVVLVVDQQRVRHEQEEAERRAIEAARVEQARQQVLQMLVEGEADDLEDDQIIDALENNGEVAQETLQAILDLRGEDIEEQLLSAVISKAGLPLLESIINNENYRDEDYLQNTDFSFILTSIAKNPNINRELINEILESDVFLDNLQYQNGVSHDILMALTHNPAVPSDVLRDIYNNPDYQKDSTILTNLAGNSNTGADILANVIDDGIQMNIRRQANVVPQLFTNIAKNPNAGQENLLKLCDLAHGVVAISTGDVLSIARNPSATHEVFDRLLNDEILRGRSCPAMFNAIIDHPNATRADRLLAERRRDAVRANQGRQ